MTEKVRKAMTSSKRDSWNTPQWFVELVWSFGDVTLDPCSNATSIVGAARECRRTLPSTLWSNGRKPKRLYLDGRWNDWHELAGGGVVYVNPPYGRGVIEEWLRKCDEEAAAGAEIVALVPARVDARWYQGCRRRADVEILGRLTFGGAPHPALFPSSVFYWGKRVERFAQIFGPLGRLHIVTRNVAGGVIGERFSPAPGELEAAVARAKTILRGSRDPLRITSTPAPPTQLSGRVALYHRVSTVDQDSAGARAELQRAAAARGLSVVLDEEETGSGAMNDRPGLQRVMQAARAHQVDTVMVWKLDRFARSAFDLLANVKELEQLGVRFISTSQGLDIQAGGDPMSRLMLQVLAAVAEFERTLIVERTKVGMKRALERGSRIGRPRALDDRSALELAKRVGTLRARHMSWAAIAVELGCGVMQARRALKGCA